MKRSRRRLLIRLTLAAACTLTLTCACPALAEDAPKQTTVTLSMTAPVVFEREAENTWLRLKDEAQSFRFHWRYQPAEGPARSTIPCDLQENQRCTFTIEGSRHPGSDTLINAQIMQITSAEGKTLYDRTICELHHCKMARKDVPILYGLPGKHPGDPTSEQILKLFPYGREIAYGGCIVMPGKTTEKVLICPQCSEAFARWKVEK